MRFARAALAIMVAGLVSACVGPDPFKSKSSLTAADVDQRMRQTWPLPHWNVVYELWEDGKWDYVVDRIGEGRPDWLQLVPLLAAGIDAAPAEELRDHLGLALPKNAPGVLAVLDPKNGPVTGADSVCSMPFGNNLTTPLPADFAARSISAVEAVKDPKLQVVRNRCLAVLRRGVCRICG